MLLDRLESELAGDQLDLIEIKPLVDGDHQAEVLESETDDLYCRHLEDLCELAHGDELVHVYCFLLALGLRLPLRGELLAITAIFGATRSAPTNRAAHRRHRLSDVSRYRFLIDASLSFFPAAAAAIFASACRAVFAAGRCRTCTGGC